MFYNLDIKGDLIWRLNFSCAWSRLNEHDPQYSLVIERAVGFVTI